MFAFTQSQAFPTSLLLLLAASQIVSGKDKNINPPSVEETKQRNFQPQALRPGSIRNTANSYQIVAGTCRRIPPTLPKTTSTCRALRNGPRIRLVLSTRRVSAARPTDARVTCGRSTARREPGRRSRLIVSVNVQRHPTVIRLPLFHGPMGSFFRGCNVRFDVKADKNSNRLQSRRI